MKDIRSSHNLRNGMEGSGGFKRIALNIAPDFVVVYAERAKQHLFSQPGLEERKRGPLHNFQTAARSSCAPAASSAIRNQELDIRVVTTQNGLPLLLGLN